MTDYSATPEEMETILANGVGDYMVKQYHSVDGTALKFEKDGVVIRVSSATQKGEFTVHDPQIGYSLRKSPSEVNKIIREALGLNEE